MSYDSRCANHDAVSESENRSNAAEVEWHLRQVQDNFVPRLSTYVHIGEYSSKLATLSTRFEAWQGTRLVGLCATYVNTGEQYLYVTSISRLLDAPAGIATRLFTRAWDFARERGCNAIKYKICSSNVHSKMFFHQACNNLALLAAVTSVKSCNGVEWEYWCASK